jgi:choline monooxygenase
MDIRPGRLPASGPAIGHGQAKRSRFGLRPVRRRLGPFVFVNRDLDAARCRTPVDCPQSWRAPASTSRGCATASARSSCWANWKAVVENYLDYYHCPTAHPSFSKVVDIVRTHTG